MLMPETMRISVVYAVSRNHVLVHDSCSFAVVLMTSDSQLGKRNMEGLVEPLPTSTLFHQSKWQPREKTIEENS